MVNETWIQYHFVKISASLILRLGKRVCVLGKVPHRLIGIIDVVHAYISGMGNVLNFKAEAMIEVFHFFLVLGGGSDYFESLQPYCKRARHSCHCAWRPLIRGFRPTSQRGINPHTTTRSAVLSIWITGSYSYQYHVHASFVSFSFFFCGLFFGFHYFITFS